MRTLHGKRASSRLLPVSLLVIAMASIQTGAAVAKRMFEVVGPIGAVTLRILFAALLLALVLRPWRLRLTPRAFRWVLVYGVALGGMNALFYAALRTIPLAVATAIELTGPLTVAVLGSRRISDFLWIALAVTGLLTLIPFPGLASDLDAAGVSFALAAGVLWAVYILVGRKAGAEHGLQTTALGMAIAATAVLPFGLAQAGTSLFTPAILPFALGAAVLSSALPYCLEMFALPRLPAKTFGTLMSAEPAFGALSGMFFLDEHLTPWQWLAIAAIMLASIGTTLTATTFEGSIPPGADPTVGDLLPGSTPPASADR